MWSAAPLPLALGSTIPAGGGPRYHLMAVGRHEDGQAQSSAQKQVLKQQQQLSGADVLMALQRASEKKKKYHDKARGNKIDEGAVRVRESSSHSSAAVIVKPLCINPQWAHQLHQLETRLHQLPHASLTS